MDPEDGKHIAIKKQKSGSEYFNYKGYFSLVLLALVDAEYKILWVNVGASGSSSAAQIFNCSKLRRKIENGNLGLPPPKPLGPGGQIYTTSFWGTMPLLFNALAGEALQQKTTDQGGENSQLQDIQRLENAFGILVGRLRVLLTTMEQRPKVVRDIVLTCVILHNMLRSHEGEQTDHPLQRMTCNHHRQTRGNRDIMRTLETH